MLLLRSRNYGYVFASISERIRRSFRSSRDIPVWERANLQVALDAYLASGERSHELVGLSAQRGWHMGLAELAQRPAPGGGGWIAVSYGAQAGPQEHVTVQVGERTIVCVAAGLFL